MRALPVALTQLALRVAAPGASGSASAGGTAAAADLTALRAELRAAARRRDAVTLGAALLIAALIWLLAGVKWPWFGWVLLGAGVLEVVYGLWR
jgi:fatty acid desaturase